QWRALPEGWVPCDVICDDNNLYIVSAERVGFHPSGDTPSKRVYVGFNPAVVKDPRRAEQLGALRPHKRLSRATPEAFAAGEKCFEQWISEGRLQPTTLTESSSTTSWYVVGGESSRRFRPVFPFIHLNRSLRLAFGKQPFSQALTSTLIDKS
ncbi:hypothetical protein FOZ62_019479, partial [Perkinsus olseni]